MNVVDLKMLQIMAVDRQCDQIVRIFAEWTILHFWAIFWIVHMYVSIENFWATYFTEQVREEIRKKRIGPHFGRLFHKNTRSHCWPTFRRQCPSVGRQVVLTTKSFPWLAYILLYFHRSDRSLPKNTWCDVFLSKSKMLNDKLSKFYIIVDIALP
jgi:hypothetical protein